MKRCIVSFVDVCNPVKMWEEMVLVDSTADKYDIHTHFEDRIQEGWIIRGIQVVDEGQKVFILD